MKYTVGLGALIALGAIAAMVSIPYRANVAGNTTRTLLRYELASNAQSDTDEQEFAKSPPYQVPEQYRKWHARINERNWMRENPELIEQEVKDAESKYYKASSTVFYIAGAVFVVGCVLMALGLDINRVARHID